jgi:D-alanyl-D-alanine-carboxypeptidase/D-alanyl-D-alanine-endopeptidase
MSHRHRSMIPPLSTSIDRSVVRVICCTILVSAFSFCTKAEEFTDALHGFLQQSVRAQSTNCGIVVGIVDERGSKVVSYGKLDNGTDADVNGDTLFEIGSVTKTFTGLLLQDMVERGEMKPDDPVAKYLPRSVTMPRRNGQEITLRQLATHTSGLVRDPDNLEGIHGDNPFADYTVERLYTFLSNCKLIHDPGEQWEYSNLGVGLLGHTIAMKAGTNYESLVEDRICRPLKMDSTRIALTEELKGRFATGHNRLGYAVPAWDIPVLAGAGGLRSTVSDLLKYVSANLGLTTSTLNPLMEKTHAAHFQRSADVQMGLAWFIFRDQDGTQIVWHGGGTGGFKAFVGFTKGARRGVVVLSNTDDFNFVFKLGIFLLEHEWESHHQSRLTEISEGYGSYVGQYQRSPDFALQMNLVWQSLREAPKALIYVPTCLYIAALLVLLWRTNSFRKRRTIAGSSLLIGGLLVMAIILVLSHITTNRFVGSQPGIGIRREGDRLFAQVIGASSSPIDMLLPLDTDELLPESEHRFFERLNGMQVAFSRDARGKVSTLTMSCRGEAFSYEKTTNQPPYVPELPKRRVATKLDTKVLDACVGTYEFMPNAALPTGGSLKIWRDGDHLVGRARSNNAEPLAFSIYPESETSFFLKTDGAQLTFIKNDRGEVTAVVRHKESQSDIEGKKVKSE